MRMNRSPGRAKSPMTGWLNSRCSSQNITLKSLKTNFRDHSDDEKQFQSSSILDGSDDGPGKASHSLSSVQRGSLSALQKSAWSREMHLDQLFQVNSDKRLKAFNSDDGPYQQELPTPYISS
ncbi:hypothetical protein PRZ48_013452 [Zasmidium cellare]|uniref:Uncharacterized protein n=1 Tax=Zasmidium cellare TaxID=395010 RepID=A0ABR0E138_ZASCE|nr:hypothetical protein PRZ48_013452 [Zasmidium cellare]